MENINTDEIKKNIVDKFDDVLEKGDWESSLFFQTIGKRLRALREQAITDLGMDATQQTQQAEKKVEETIADDEMLVYISLYQADGKNIQKWQMLIKALTGAGISRPVYQQKEDLEELIRHKVDSQKEAYVIARVKKENLLRGPEKGLQDRLGHPLLTLREGSLTLENMVEFIYEGKHYMLDEGKVRSVL